jgi:Ca2+-binding EF-hand superfamily protein
MDTDTSGSLTYWEFSQGLKKVGLRLEKAQVETLLAALDRDGDGEVSVADFVAGVVRQVDVRFGAQADASARQERLEQRERERELARVAFEAQQRDAAAASQLSAYDVRTAWNKVNRAIAKKGAKSMVKLFEEFDQDGNGVVDRSEFLEGMARLGVKLSRAEFEACWQYADPRGEVKRRRALIKKRVE